MRRLLVILLLTLCSLTAFAQKGDLRKGNRQFRRGEFPKADISYRKALMQDSTSVAVTYNLANTLYREKDMENARRLLDGAKEAAGAEAFASDYYYNLGDVAIAQQDWQAAVDALKQSLLLCPDDVKAKENYIYARNKLMEQQQNQDQQGDGQDNQNQDQDQNQDQQDQQNQDQNQDQNQNQDQQDQNQGQGQQGEAQISPQQAQQMLQAIQQKEKETQEKVDEKKAAALKSRQKEKNW